jgi:hypothetical protein
VASSGFGAAKPVGIAIAPVAGPGARCDERLPARFLDSPLMDQGLSALVFSARVFSDRLRGWGAPWPAPWGAGNGGRVTRREFNHVRYAIDSSGSLIFGRDWPTHLE